MTFPPMPPSTHVVIVGDPRPRSSSPFYHAPGDRIPARDAAHAKRLAREVREHGWNASIEQLET